MSNHLIFDISSSLKKMQMKNVNRMDDFHFSFYIFHFFILWGDETLGRHALLSRGWGTQNKQSVEPTLSFGKADQG